VIKPYRKLLRDVGNVFISTIESRKPMATAKPTKPRPVRFVLFTDVLVLSEPKDGYLVLSTEPNSQLVLHKVDLAHATINTYGDAPPHTHAHPHTHSHTHTHTHSSTPKRCGLAQGTPSHSLQTLTCLLPHSPPSLHRSGPQPASSPLTPSSAHLELGAPCPRSCVWFAWARRYKEPAKTGEGHSFTIYSSSTTSAPKSKGPAVTSADQITVWCVGWALLSGVWLWVPLWAGLPCVQCEGGPGPLSPLLSVLTPWLRPPLPPPPPPPHLHPPPHPTPGPGPGTPQFSLPQVQ
jgi:hypothetical protein